MPLEVARLAAKEAEGQGRQPYVGTQLYSERPGEFLRSHGWIECLHTRSTNAAPQAMTLVTLCRVTVAATMHEISFGGNLR